MSPNNLEVYVICAASSIEPGGAKAFSLFRINEAGESRPFPIVVAQEKCEGIFRLCERLPA